MRIHHRDPLMLKSMAYLALQRDSPRSKPGSQLVAMEVAKGLLLFPGSSALQVQPFRLTEGERAALSKPKCSFINLWQRQSRLHFS